MYCSINFQRINFIQLLSPTTSNDRMKKIIRDSHDMLYYISKKENIFELKINSNGSFLTEKLCHDIFKSNVTTVVISADHYEKKTFEELRKFSNLKQALIGILSDIQQDHRVENIIYFLIKI